MGKILLRSAVVLACLALPLLWVVRSLEEHSSPAAEPLPMAATTSASTDGAAMGAATQSAPRTVFVHLFEWTWDDIAQECETVLGPKGFEAVQISPPNEHVVLPEMGFPWWQRYQPVSYRLESRSGDRQQLANMVSRCRAVGVQIYADAVINHMAAEDRGIGSAGTVFTKYNYPGLYGPEDFHTCRTGITDYGDRQMVTTCELVGLPDLNTTSPAVQQHIADYLLDLLRLGVGGFRIDAAKHISAPDLGAILQRVQQATDAEPVIIQEVIDPGTEAVGKAEYYAYGLVNEFEYGRLVGATFLGLDGQSLAQLESLGPDWGLAPSDAAVVFIDNHDKQRGHGGGGTYLTYKDGALYTLANVFMLAWPYGYPQVMSSYAFSDSDQGPPSDPQGQTIPVYRNGQAQCFGAWGCEHRQTAIANMVGFRNAIPNDAPVRHWWSNGRNQIAFSRGEQGFVAINRDADPLSHTFQTGLPAGTYCNIIRAERQTDGRSCTAEGAASVAGPDMVTVNAQGEVTLTVESMGAIAIHIGQQVRP